jgi:hypothetical protein
MLADGGIPAFLISDKCNTLRKGFMGRYRFRRMSTASERYEMRPEKTLYSHPHDALQYIATRIFGSSLVGEGDDFRDYDMNDMAGYADNSHNPTGGEGGY